VHIGAHADAKATVRDHRSHSQISEIGHLRSCWLENQIDLELDFDFNRDYPDRLRKAASCRTRHRYSLLISCNVAVADNDDAMVNRWVSSSVTWRTGCPQPTRYVRACKNSSFAFGTKLPSCYRPFSLSQDKLRSPQDNKQKNFKTRVGLLETATWQESNGHVVDPGEYTLLVCHDTRGLGGDQAGAERIKAEEGKCLTHTVTI
jgi:hypothetical protein